MFADLLPPPTLIFDWHTLGFPAGPIVFFAVTASIFTAAVVLARRRVRAYWIILLCLFLFVAADLATYFIGINLPRSPRPRPDFFENKNDDAKPNREMPAKPKE